MIVRELITKLGFRADEKAMDRFESRVKSVARSMESIGSKMTMFVTAPLTALGAYALKSASDANEIASKFSVVFADVQTNADAVAENLKKNYGMSGTAAKDLLSNTGDLLTGFGFTGQAALDLSDQVAKLAVDLTSMKNFAGGSKGAAAALTKAMLGETESAKALGIAILDVDIKSEVAALKAKGLKFATERQAKAYAVMSIATRQAKNSIGDFARTSESLANKFRTVQARAQDLVEQFGAKLLPIALKAAGFAEKLIAWVDKMDDSTKEFVVILAAAAAAMGPIIAALGIIIPLVISFGAAVLWVPLAIAALIAIIALLVQDIKVWSEGGDSMIGRYLGSWTEFRDSFMEIINSIRTGITDLVNFLIPIFEPFFIALMEVLNWVLSAIGGVFKIIGGLLTGNMQKVAEGIGQIFYSLFEAITSAMVAVFQGVIAGAKLIGGLLEGKGMYDLMTGAGKLLLGAGDIASNVAAVNNGQTLVAGATPKPWSMAPSAAPVAQSITFALPPGTSVEQGNAAGQVAADVARGIFAGTATDNSEQE